MLFALFLSAAGLAPPAAAAPLHAHDRVIDHRSGAYRLTYRAHVAMRMKTVGMSAGTRMSTERCSWTSRVLVERHIARVDGGHGAARILPSERRLGGSVPGSCRQAARAVETAVRDKAATVRAHVTEVAAADHGAALAEIDAGPAVAMR